MVQPARLRGRLGLSAALLGTVLGRFASSRRIWSRLDKALLPVWVHCFETHGKVPFYQLRPTDNRDSGRFQRYHGRVVIVDPSCKKERAIPVLEPLGLESEG